MQQILSIIMSKAQHFADFLLTFNMYMYLCLYECLRRLRDSEEIL